jgi:hypothetical protein
VYKNERKGRRGRGDWMGKWETVGKWCLTKGNRRRKRGALRDKW